MKKKYCRKCLGPKTIIKGWLTIIVQHSIPRKFVHLSAKTIPGSSRYILWQSILNSFFDIYNCKHNADSTRDLRRLNCSTGPKVN